jgi:hypothetical protein
MLLISSPGLALMSRGYDRGAAETPASRGELRLALGTVLLLAN